MKRLLRRVLARLGLALAADNQFVEVRVEWRVDSPVHVDLRFKNGQRVVGYLAPWWPNKNPILRAANNPFMGGSGV